MTGIIRFPRGGRSTKVTKPASMAQPRRTANGGTGNGNASPSAVANRQALAVEQALGEQQKQQQQQYDASTTDSISAEAVQSLTHDVAFENATDPVHDALKTEYIGGSDGGDVSNDRRNSNNDRDDAVVDDEMLDLHGGHGGHSSGSAHQDNGSVDNMVVAMEDADMGEMVAGAVDGFRHVDGGGLSATAARAQSIAQPETPRSHDLNIDLSAAAAAAAAAAVASASHLATAGENDNGRPHDNNNANTSSGGAVRDSEYATNGTPATPALTGGRASAARRAQQAMLVDAAATIQGGASAATGRTAAVAKRSSSVASSAPITAQMARDSGYDHLPVESALAKRLAREPGLRPAQQRRPEQQLNLGRRSNVEALFAHIAGDEVTVPCKNCHKGHGPWTACVVVDGQMCGSCANCWFNASGARCSFHETKTPVQGHLHAHQQRQSLGGVVSASPSAAAAASVIDPQLAAVGPYTIGSPIGGIAAHAPHHFATQQQQQHGQPHALPSTGAHSSSASAAAQQAATAAAAAVAVQQLNNGGNSADGGVSHGNGAAAGTTDLSSASSSLGLHLVAALLGGGGGRGGLFSNTADAGSARAAAGAQSDSTPLAGFVINQALAEVRNADERTRDLMLVEIAAKQLALAIVRYGEGASGCGGGNSSTAAASKDETADHTETVEAAPDQGPHRRVSPEEGAGSA